jgi:hypothetical protein
MVLWKEQQILVVMVLLEGIKEEEVRSSQKKKPGNKFPV